MSLSEFLRIIYLVISQILDIDFLVPVSSDILFGIKALLTSYAIGLSLMFSLWALVVVGLQLSTALEPISAEATSYTWRFIVFISRLIYNVAVLVWPYIPLRFLVNVSLLLYTPIWFFVLKLGLVKLPADTSLLYRPSQEELVRLNTKESESRFNALDNIFTPLWFISNFFFNLNLLILAFQKEKTYSHISIPVESRQVSFTALEQIPEKFEEFNPLKQENYSLTPQTPAPVIVKPISNRLVIQEIIKEETSSLTSPPVVNSHSVTNLPVMGWEADITSRISKSPIKPSKSLIPHIQEKDKHDSVTENLKGNSSDISNNKSAQNKSVTDIKIETNKKTSPKSLDARSQYSKPKKENFLIEELKLEATERDVAKKILQANAAELMQTINDVEVVSPGKSQQSLRKYSKGSELASRTPELPIISEHELSLDDIEHRRSGSVEDRARIFGGKSPIGMKSPRKLSLEQVPYSIEESSAPINAINMALSPLESAQFKSLIRRQSAKFTALPKPETEEEFRPRQHRSSTFSGPDEAEERERLSLDEKIKVFGKRRAVSVLRTQKDKEISDAISKSLPDVVFDTKNLSKNISQLIESLILSPNNRNDPPELVKHSSHPLISQGDRLRMLRSSTFSGFGAFRNVVINELDSPHDRLIKSYMNMQPERPIGYDDKEGIDLFSYEEILRKNYCKDFGNTDPKHLEKYLTNAEFGQLFSMNKNDFEQLPKWRQVALKKAHALF